jgi:enoyl-CoA hydratase/carnithine racemase
MQTIRFEVEEGLAWITLCRPEKLNAINLAMREEIWQAVNEAWRREDVRVLLFTGEGRAFSAGGDMQVFERSWDETASFRREVSLFTRTFDLLETIEKPVIAAINGICTGAGLQLTLSCDLRIASESAVFAFLENNIGLLPGAGGCSRLVKLVGYGKAKELVLLGEKISAVEALQAGLVNRVVAHSRLLPEAREIAQKLSAKAREALGLAKRVLQASIDADLATGRLLEFLGQSILLKTEDHQKGVKAFREKSLQKKG